MQDGDTNIIIRAALEVTVVGAPPLGGALPHGGAMPLHPSLCIPSPPLSPPQRLARRPAIVEESSEDEDIADNINAPR